MKVVTQNRFLTWMKQRCWKKVTSRTFTAREEKSVSGFKVSKDRLTFLLGVNAVGDFKSKSMII